MDPSRIHTCGENGNADAPDSPAKALSEAVAQIGELKEYASHFVAAKADGIKASLRKAAVYGALGALAAVAGAAAIVTGVVLLLNGLAQAIALLLGGRMWAGNLIVGFLLICAVALGAWLGVRRFFGSSRARTVDRYERRLQQQRANFGHDARERAAEQSASSD